MTDRTMRLRILLAAAPLTFFLATLAGTAATSAGIEEHRAASTTGVVALVVVTIAVWRRYVSWTTLRTMSTLSLIGLLFAQALIWKPILWSSDCSSRIMMTHGQNGVAAGIWCMACGMLW